MAEHFDCPAVSAHLVQQNLPKHGSRDELCSMHGDMPSASDMHMYTCCNEAQNNEIKERVLDTDILDVDDY